MAHTVTSMPARARDVSSYDSMHSSPERNAIARFPRFAFFRNLSVAPRMGLGDDLVTTRVLEHPWGSM